MRVETEDSHGNYSLLRAHRVNEMLNTSALNKVECNVRRFILTLFVRCLLKVASWFMFSHLYFRERDVFELADGDPLSQRLEIHC